ncbi:MAG: hypothetical protein MRZ84_09540 [Eubacterium sp.]|nr:hypothetical protein [Eubacterium sp.]
MKKKSVYICLLCLVMLMLCSCGSWDAVTITGKDIDSIVGPAMTKSQESNDRNKVNMVHTAFTTAIAGHIYLSDIYGVTADELDATLKEEIENVLGQSIEEVEKEFQSPSCEGKRLYFYYSNNTIVVGVGSVEGTENQEGQKDFYVSNNYEEDYYDSEEDTDYDDSDYDDSDYDDSDYGDSDDEEDTGLFGL